MSYASSGNHLYTTSMLQDGNPIFGFLLPNSIFNPATDLLQIAEVKNYFSNHKKELEKNYEKIKQSKPSTARDGPAFLFSAHTAASDADLRAELPSKSAVDKLVTRYMNSYDPAVHILHSPTFHKQLQAHWADPAKTSIVWLGLLYSILCLAMQSYHKIGDEPLEWKGR